VNTKKKKSEEKSALNSGKKEDNLQINSIDSAASAGEFQIIN